MKRTRTTFASSRFIRKVWLIHIVFSLLGMVTLFLGVTWITERFRAHAFENACLATVSKVQSQVSVSRLISEDKLQSMVNQLLSRENLVECSVIDADGIIQAHSNPEQIGQTTQEPIGHRRVADGREEIRYTDPHHGRLRQYIVPLNSGRMGQGELRVTFKDLPTWVSAAYARPDLAVALVLPLLIALAGGQLLRRLITPYQRIHDQLARLNAIPRLTSESLRPLESSDPSTLGWNRLVQELDQLTVAGPIDDRLEAAIRRCQADRSRELLETLPVGIAETDPEGRIEFLNQAMRALLGASAESIEGKPLESLLPLEAESEARAKLFGQPNLNREATLEITRPSPSGDRVLRISRHPIGSAERNRQAWEIRDVTQAKLAERARNEFLDSATHEIRTPLANIKAYAETLTMNEVTDIEQQKEFCNVINSEATRLARFIDELLDISSIEAGSLTIQPQAVETARLLEEVVGKVRPQMVQKDITFETVVAEKLPELTLDKDKFSTCLINLLGNAAKYTPEGGMVTFRARVEEHHLILDVEDTGIGIPADELPKVFEKFYRGKDSRVHAEPGTGLGLAFTHEVVNLHHGTVTVESKPDQGSRFTITLPIQ